MKKNYSNLFIPFLLILLSISFGCNKGGIKNLNSGQSKLVPENIARIVAQNFNPAIYINTNNPTNHSPVKTTLNGSNVIKNILPINDHNNIPAFYICNFEKLKGFLIVSADYRIAPVLAFIEQGEFSTEKWKNNSKDNIVPYGFTRWVNTTIENVEMVRKGLYDSTQHTIWAWRNYLAKNAANGTVAKSSDKDAFDKAVTAEPTDIKIPAIKPPPPPPNPCANNPDYESWGPATTVGPLLTVTWGQQNTYNDLCPNVACIEPWGPNALTGCVATSTAQILDYWHPANSYNYNYASMPATTGNAEVERLMSDIGIQVNMQYGCEVSLAFAQAVPGALKTYFGISSANYSGYSSANVYQVITDLNNLWPVILAGVDATDGGHQWVCDGYNESAYTYCSNGEPQTINEIILHMNWGWHEYFTNPPYNESDYNGWFTYNNWAIAGLNRNYQYSDASIMEIHP
jgi:hypothetical protein